jgi:hypothetical protein
MTFLRNHTAVKILFWADVMWWFFLWVITGPYLYKHANWRKNNYAVI